MPLTIFLLCRLVQSGELTPEEAHGIRARSPLFDLRGFDFTQDMPAEPFHLFWEGITRQILVRLFINRKTRETKALLRKCNAAFSQMCVFQESPRKARAISVMQMTGSELQTVALSAFPYMANKLMRGLQGQEW